MPGTNVGGIYFDVALDTKSLIDGSRKADRVLGELGTKLTATASAVGILGAALAAMKVAKLADEIRMLAARVDVAAGSAQKGADAFAELVGVSRRTQTSLEGNIEVFNRLNQSILAMGGSQRDTIQVTELLSKAIKVSGASAVEAKAAMLQFGQALGSGKLQGDELRSLMETAPYLMRQLADGIGVPVGALKKLGEEGKLTADVVTNALTKAAAKIDEDFKKLPQTIEAAMVVAQDQAALAALKFDDLTGGSAVLAGVVKGLGEVLEQLGQQFAAATTEADKLGKNGAVKSWADGTVLVLSYVADAGDFVVRMFKQMGTLIGGVAASLGQLASGQLINSAKTIAQMKKDLLDIGNAQYSGARMRQALEAPLADYSNKGRGSKGTSSTLKTPAGAAEKSKFDALGYLGGLEKAAAEAYDKVDVIEREANRKNAQLLKEGKITREQAAAAAVLIEEEAARARQEILKKETEGLGRTRDEYRKREQDAQRKAEEARNRGRELASGIITGQDEVSKVQADAAAKSEALLQAFMIDQQNAELYAQARVALEQETAAKIKAIREKEAAERDQQQSAQLMAYSNLFSNLADVTKNFAGKQSAAYRVLFAASKAFAIADSIIKIQQGIANAAALPFPANIPAMGAVIAATSSIVSTIASTNYGGGRQYGGPVNAGTMYRVNETGRPEMFTAANGSQYMLPTAGGNVTPADKVGGAGVQVLVQVQNSHPTAQVTAQTDESGRIVQIAVAEVASQIGANSGPVWSAMRSATNVQGRL